MNSPDVIMRDVLANAKRFTKSETPDFPHSGLKFVYADELSEKHQFVDELVEGLLTKGGSSAIFGESNSGKTFLALDLGCAVARGVKWMGKNTEQGIVIYLAAEAPASIRARLHAYQLHHGIKVPYFVVVESPINLYSNETDMDAVIKLVRQVEAQLNKKAMLIIGDTLARLSAGANENSGQDMGLIVQRIDRIREELDVHFCLVHHSGKNAANGMRGWSGIRGAIDTEIEVVSCPSGHYAEITKQRDLPTNGARIGFRLDTVQLGQNKWGRAATTCVVIPADAPSRTTAKRISEVGGAIKEKLASETSGMTKKEIVAHLKGRYDSSSVYRELKKLVEAGLLDDKNGTFTLATHEDADRCELVPKH